MVASIKSKENHVEKYPVVSNFKHSNRQFDRFLGETNYHFSKVNSDISQKTPSQRKPAVQKFHAKLLRERKRGTFALCDIANIDQKSLPFALDNEQWESIRRKWF